MKRSWTCSAILNFSSGTLQISLNHLIIKAIILSSELVNFTLSPSCLSPSAQYKHKPTRNRGFLAIRWNSSFPRLIVYSVRIFFSRFLCSPEIYPDNSLPFNIFSFIAFDKSISRNHRLSVDLETPTISLISRQLTPFFRSLIAFCLSANFILR